MGVDNAPVAHSSFHFIVYFKDEEPKMTSMQHALIALAAAGLLAGCTSTKLDADVPPAGSTATLAKPGGSGTGSGAAAGTSQSQVAPVDLTQTNTVAAGNLPKVVYFDFDSYVVKDEFRNVVEANAKALVADKKMRLAIEGHTDERGGREYNLALGQKRAEAVAKSMALLGAGATQMEPVSFGKERPAAQGSDEAAWAKNRRAELVGR
jgi:peptidoglycan-associated lipoprotein